MLKNKVNYINYIHNSMIIANYVILDNELRRYMLPNSDIITKNIVYVFTVYAHNDIILDKPLVVVLMAR